MRALASTENHPTWSLLVPLSAAFPSLPLAMAAAALRFEASMVLSGALDALGYRAGAWEFCKSTATVRAECAALAGRPSPLPLTLAPPLFPLSDDTVMHLRTAQAINVADVHEMPSRLRERYVTCLDEQCLMGRAFGPTTISALRALKASPLSVLSVPFSGTGGGCGGAMRVRVACPRGLEGEGAF